MFCVRFAAEIEVVGDAARGVVRQQICRVVTAVDGPVVAGAEEVSELGAVPGLGSQKTALARLFFQGLVEIGKVENRDACADERRRRG